MKVLSPVGTAVSPLPEQSAPPSSSQLQEGEHTAVDCPWPEVHGRRNHHKHTQNNPARIFFASVQVAQVKRKGLRLCFLPLRTLSSHMWLVSWGINKWTLPVASPPKKENSALKLAYAASEARALSERHFSTAFCRISPWKYANSVDDRSSSLPCVFRCPINY